MKGQLLMFEDRAIDEEVHKFLFYLSESRGKKTFIHSTKCTFKQHLNIGQALASKYGKYVMAVTEPKSDGVSFLAPENACMWYPGCEELNQDPVYEKRYGQTLWFSDELFGLEEEREGNAVDRRGTR